MDDDDDRQRDALFKWGVSAKPLRPAQAGRDVTTGVDARPGSTPVRPPRGGSAVPPRGPRKQKRKK